MGDFIEDAINTLKKMNFNLNIDTDDDGVTTELNFEHPDTDIKGSVHVHLDENFNAQTNISLKRDSKRGNYNSRIQNKFHELKPQKNLGEGETNATTDSE